MAQVARRGPDTAAHDHDDHHDDAAAATTPPPTTGVTVTPAPAPAPPPPATPKPPKPSGQGKDDDGGEPSKAATGRRRRRRRARTDRTRTARRRNRRHRRPRRAGPRPGAPVYPTVSCGSTPGAPAALLPIYQRASDAYGLGPQGPAILASINGIESAFGANMGPSSAGAIGWMQFLPSTWDTYGVDANGDGEADPYDPQDAIFAAANYLSASGMPADTPGAIFSYNHADWYVAEVLANAGCYGTFDGTFSLTPGKQVIACTAGRRRTRSPSATCRPSSRRPASTTSVRRGVWALAGVAQLESNFGRDEPPQLRETGPLGLDRDEWNRFEVDGDSDGLIRHASIEDSAATLARELWSRGSLRAGLFLHNQASWYVEQVLEQGEQISGKCKTRLVEWNLALPLADLGPDQLGQPDALQRPPAERHRERRARPADHEPARHDHPDPPDHGHGAALRPLPAHGRGQRLQPLLRPRDGHRRRRRRALHRHRADLALRAARPHADAAAGATCTQPSSSTATTSTARARPSPAPTTATTSTPASTASAGRRWSRSPRLRSGDPSPSGCTGRSRRRRSSVDQAPSAGPRARCRESRRSPRRRGNRAACPRPPAAGRRRRPCRGPRPRRRPARRP